MMQHELTLTYINIQYMKTELAWYSEKISSSIKSDKADNLYLHVLVFFTLELSEIQGNIDVKVLN